MEKKSISIIIPAYNSSIYIKECLDSIKEQTYFNDFNGYEILIGVDACEETLKKLKEIKNNYQNLRIFMMDSNKGPYVTKNSLIPLAKYEIVQFFDSDDIMLPNMIEDNMNFLMNGFDAVSNQFEPYVEDNTSYVPYGKNAIAAGVVAVKKPVLKKLGGFQPWPMSADGEFVNRIIKAGFNRKVYYETRFKVRIHKNSLTNTPSSRQGSAERIKYDNMSRANKLTPLIYIKPVINNYKEI